MAYAIDAATYSVTQLNDDLDGTPDNWTDVGATHSYASSELTVIDNAGGTSEYAYNDQGSQTARTFYVRTTWRRTADNASTPMVLSITDTSLNISMGLYQDMSTNSIFARNGAGWTDTGVTLATATNQQLEFVGDRDAGTWTAYFDGVAKGPYTIETNTDAAFGRTLIGGGSTAATWTYVFSDVILVKNTLGAAGGGSKRRRLLTGIGS